MSYQRIIENFEKNVSSIEKLIVIDEFILDSTIDALEKRQGALEASGIENAGMLGSNTIQSLKNIRKNKSLKPLYRLVYNQSVVLMVSYFSSSLHDLFDFAVTETYTNGVPKKATDKELRFSLEELSILNFDLTASIGSVISKKHNVSFQDMASVRRAFKDYLGIEINRDRTVNNIIVMQACRHAIAHAEQICDDKLLNQIRDCGDRDIQKELKRNQEIQFNPMEIDVGSAAMKTYVANLVDQLNEKQKNA